MRHFRFKIITITALLILSVMIGIHFFNYKVTFQSASLSESNKAVVNPYCGFYHLYGYLLSDTNIQETEDWCEQRLLNDSNSIALIEINLKNYSNKKISDVALNQLETICDAYANAKKQIILRFLYDWDGKALETEPVAMKGILSHMEQLAPIINRHTNTIYLMQGVFTGNCGEMNQTHYGDNNHIIKLMEQLASVTSPDIFLSVRTPAHLRTITKAGTPLTKQQAYTGTLASRLGLYNDGMLGTVFDCGTYDDTPFDTSDYTQKGTREEEIAFQEKLCQFVPNGGEAILENPYNDLSNAINDMSRMHVSYLNCDYDKKVLNKWKNTIYSGYTDDIFNECTGYEYIQAHIGYRYVLRGFQADVTSLLFRKYALQVEIENTGFSPCYRPLDITFILLNNASGQTITLPANFDSRMILPGETIKILVEPDSLPREKGDYTVSVSITDRTTKIPVSFANQQTNPDGSVTLGQFTIS